MIVPRTTADVSKRNKGLKKQVLGSILFLLGITVILLDIKLGIQIDTFYIVLIGSGIFLFLVGTIQKGSRQR